MSTLVRAAAIAVLLVACGGSEGKYNTIPRGKIHTEMWKLMSLTTELDNLMRETSPHVPQAKAVELLANIEGTAELLAKRDQRDKHPMLEDNASTFLRMAKEARTAAAAAPPNYYYAGIVSGSCVLCHDPDGGIR